MAQKTSPQAGASAFARHALAWQQTAGTQSSSRQQLRKSAPSGASLPPRPWPPPSTNTIDGESSGDIISGEAEQPVNRRTTPRVPNRCFVRRMATSRSRPLNRSGRVRSLCELHATFLRGRSGPRSVSSHETDWVVPTRRDQSTRTPFANGRYARPSNHRRARSGAGWLPTFPAVGSTSGGRD
jgi:hypothetical protein